MSRIAKARDKPKRRKSEEIVELLKVSRQDEIEDGDVWENNKVKLRFRKFPWVFWIMGLIWILCSSFLIYALIEDLKIFKSHKIFKEYAGLAFCMSMGILFLYKGKIRTIVLDKQEGTFTVKKRNIFCDKRSIYTYRLRDITDVRAVHRGYKSGGIDTETYKIIVEFERNRYEDSDEKESFSSSDSDSGI